MRVGAFLNTPTVARAKYVEKVVTTVHTLAVMNLATFRTIVLDLTCTESYNGARSQHQKDEDEDEDANLSNKPLVLAAFVRQVANRTTTLPRHVVVLCEFRTPFVIRAIEECLPSSFHAEVVAWAPEIELGIRLAVTPVDELAALDVAKTKTLHVTVSPQTVRVIEAALQRLNRLVQLQLTNVRLDLLADILRVDKGSLPLLETFGAEIDDACYCFNRYTTCACLMVTAQVYDDLFICGNDKLQAVSLVNVRVNEEKIAKLVTAKELRSISLHISGLHHEEDNCFDAGLQARVQAIFDKSNLEHFFVSFDELAANTSMHNTFYSSCSANSSTQVL